MDSLTKVSISSGDVLVVRVNRVATEDDLKRARDHIKKLMAEVGYMDVPVIAIDSTLSLCVLHKDGVKV